jgi:hypothetical protein
LQRRSSDHAESSVPPIVHEVLRSPGQSLDLSARAFMEPRFGHDFGRVRVHADAKAAGSARAVNALAYTVGRDVVFGSGQYAPGTAVGQRLLAHELAHTVQQEGTAPGLGPAFYTTRPDDSVEVEADRAAEAALTGATVAVHPAVQQPATPLRSPRLAEASDPAESVADRIAEKFAESPISMRSRMASRRFNELSIPTLQRQQAEQMKSPPRPIWYMLKAPPAIKQHALTCWAAALSSWLEVWGIDKQPLEQIILRYAGTACIDTHNALPYRTANEVFAEWGVTFVKFSRVGSVTFATLKAALQRHGHLLLAQVGGPLGHAMVVYGVGFDEKGEPNPDYMSVMDPLAGKHVNMAISSLSYPVELGHQAPKRVRPAPCLSKPGDVPND